MTAPNQLAGLLCLESSWDNDGDLRDKTSVEAQLRMFQDAEQCGDVIHRDVATLPEFTHYIKKWMQDEYAERYPLAYLSLHGSDSGFWAGEDEEMTLGEFAELVGPDSAQGRIFYFGGCATMRGDADELRRFCKTTRAKAIVGYTEDVTWHESTAMDCLLVPRLLEMKNMASVYTGLARRYPDLVRILGLRLATASKVLPD